MIIIPRFVIILSYYYYVIDHYPHTSSYYSSYYSYFNRLLPVATFSYYNPTIFLLYKCPRAHHRPLLTIHSSKFEVTPFTYHTCFSLTSLPLYLCSLSPIFHILLLFCSPLFNVHPHLQRTPVGGHMPVFARILNTPLVKSNLFV